MISLTKYDQIISIIILTIIITKFFKTQVIITTRSLNYSITLKYYNIIDIKITLLSFKNLMFHNLVN